MGEEVAPSVHLEELLATAVLLVGASAAAIVLSRRAGLGTVIGLIAVGIVLGPYTPGPVIDIAPVTAAAEIGVVLLLFVLGLEIEPQRLWAMRRMLFGLGTLQVLMSGVVLALVAMAFGRPWPAALIAGFGLSLSSTAFVLQLLAERGEFGTAHGRAAFAVLLLLVQGGEFGFVLFNAARAAAIIDTEFYTTLLLVISASMALTPIVVRLGDRLAGRLAAAEPVPEPAEFQPQAEALVVGYGRVGHIVMDTLRRAGVEATAVDIDPTRPAVGRRLGHRVLYGDAADPRLLDQVGSVGTRVVVVAVDQPDRAEAAVSAARAAYPQALVLARAHDNDRRPKLERLGASVVLTETLELGLGLAEAALRRLEVPEEAAREALASGRRQDPYPTSERPKT